jgi:outer membrane protein OmpA-like peptidoglycan-associated protein
MCRRVLLTAAALGGLSLQAARAQPVSGPYVSLGGGINILQDERLSAFPNPATGSKLSYNVGPAGVGAVGWGFGNGFRVEVEGNFRQNDLNSFSAPGAHASNGNQENYGAMANGIFDMDVGANWVYPYIGVGVGYGWTKWDQIGAYTNAAIPGAPYGFAANGTDGHFAYQALFGLSFPVAYLPGLSLTAEYRFYSVTSSSSFPGLAYSSDRAGPQRAGSGTDYNHTGLIGLRYELFPPAPPPPAPPVPPPPPPPAPEAARTYLVFFDWDRADLSDRARQIVAEAAQASTHVQTTRIEVNGYTDLSGTEAYNQQLSVRRAKSVEAELIKDGVAANEIAIHGYGEENPLVPTAKGVREPQNRRVEIILH